PTTTSVSTRCSIRRANAPPGPAASPVPCGSCSAGRSGSSNPRSPTARPCSGSAATSSPGGSSSRADGRDGYPPAMTLPPIAIRPEGRPLHADVRTLASTLGRVIARLEGRDAFDAVEALRAACRARRRGEPGAADLDALLARVDALPLGTAAVVARAFTLFFL